MHPIRPNDDKQTDDDWRTVKDWRNEFVTSDGRSLLFPRWILPVVVNGLSGAMVIKHWHHLDSLPPPGLLALAFSVLLGITLLFSAGRATVRYLRQGQMHLRMTPFPARLGQRLRVTSVLPAHYRTDRMRVSLACHRSLPKREERISQHEEAWQEVQHLKPQVGAHGPMLAGEFKLPGDLPASAWKTGQTPVSWSVRIESSDGGLDRSFTIPVLAQDGGMPSRTAEEPAGRQDDSHLADAYLERRGGVRTVDSLGQVGARRGHGAGAMMTVFGLLCFVFPTLWYQAADWTGSSADILSIGIGLLLLLPTLLGLVLLFSGLAMLGKRVRTTLADGRLTVENRNWLRVARSLLPANAVQRIEVKTTVRLQNAQRNDGVFALVAHLDNGKKLELAWGLRDAPSAAALADVLLRTCRENAGTGATAGPIRRLHRPALPLMALILLPPLSWLALQSAFRLQDWDGQPDDQARIAWLTQRATVPGYFVQWLGERDALRWPPEWLAARWIGEARARLAAQRQAPAAMLVKNIPLAPPPVVDGSLDEAEWRNALLLTLNPPDLGTTVRLHSDGRHLYFGADVPADTTKEGFDQFRVWYHIDLSRAFGNERVFLGRHGNINVLRGLRPGMAAGHHERSLTQRLRFPSTQGAARLAGHRQYELALDLLEAGIEPGVPFNLWIEIEGDPQRHPTGKFKSRASLGMADSLAQPGWYRIEPGTQSIRQ